MARVVFLNDTSNWYHWGCTGTSQAIKSQLVSKGHEVVSIPINFHSTAACTPDTPKQYGDPVFFERASRENTDLFNTLSSADMIIVNGEGTLHYLNPAASRLLFVCYAAKHYLKKNVQIINHSAYPEAVEIPTDSANFMIYRIIYSMMDYIAIREHLSHRLMSRLGVDCVLSFDCLPIAIKAVKSGLNSEDNGKVVIAGSVSFTEEGVSEIGQYIRALNHEGVGVQVLTGAADFPSQEEAEFVQKLRQEDCEWQYINAKSLEQWLQTIASAHLLVSGRFHHSIAAAFLQTGFIILNSNTPKNLALTGLFKVDPPIGYDVDNLHRKLLQLTEKRWDSPLVDNSILHNLEERALKNFAHV